MEHIFNAPSTSTLMSEILLRQQQQQSELFQHWPKLENTATQSSWERDTLLTRVYSNKCSEEQQQQRQFLATQLLYAQFLQQPPQSSDRVPEIVGLNNKTNKSETTTDNISNSTLVQDNNNNINPASSSTRCKLETDPFSPKGNLIREQKNALGSIKKGLEKLMRLCNRFQQNLSTPNNLTDDATRLQNEPEKEELRDMALELTVQRELDNNRNKIEAMLSQVRRLHQQWSSAELYYQRSLQRLGLPSEHAIGTSLPTHDVMALAAIALSAEYALQPRSEMEANSKLAENTSITEKPRTLQDIENIMLQQANEDHLLNDCSPNTTSSENEDEDNEDDVGDVEDRSTLSPPRCLWHPRNLRTKGFIEGAGTAAEIILEYASQSRLNSSSLLNPIVTADNLHEPASYLPDFNFPPTPATPPNSSNSGCSTGTISGSNCKQQHRRKSHYARKIETSSVAGNVKFQSELNGNAIKLVTIASLPIESPTAATAAPPPLSSVALTSSSAVAAVAALKERALTDMFKAQFSAMTVAAGISNESDIKPTINTIASRTTAALNENYEGLLLSDAPYDLSIGNRLKQM